MHMRQVATSVLTVLPIVQIINLAKNIKTPSLTVYLLGEAAKDREAAKNVQCSLEYTTLRRVTEATEIHYDPDPTVCHRRCRLSVQPASADHVLTRRSAQDTVIEEDKELVTSFFELEEQTNVDRMSPWLLRIELNREMMVDKKLTMSQVAEKITSEFGDELHCIFSDDNAENLILRVRCRQDGYSHHETTVGHASQPCQSIDTCASADQIRIMSDEASKGDEAIDTFDDAFLKKIEMGMLSQIALQVMLTDITLSCMNDAVCVQTLITLHCS